MTSRAAESSTATAERPRPRLRGVFHQYAFLAFAVLGLALVATAPSGTARVAAAVFAGSVVLTFGVSALYHRVTWQPAARRLMRRLDHSAIFLLIAGTYTPYGLLVLAGAWRFSVLAVVWIGAALAIAQSLLWIDRPKWLPVILGVVLGWAGVVAFPQILDVTGSAGALLAPRRRGALHASARSCTRGVAPIPCRTSSGTTSSSTS